MLIGTGLLVDLTVVEISERSDLGNSHRVSFVWAVAEVNEKRPKRKLFLSYDRVCVRAAPVLHVRW